VYTVSEFSKLFNENNSKQPTDAATEDKQHLHPLSSCSNAVWLGATRWHFMISYWAWPVSVVCHSS